MAISQLEVSCKRIEICSCDGAGLQIEATIWGIEVADVNCQSIYDAIDVEAFVDHRGLKLAKD